MESKNVFWEKNNISIFLLILKYLHTWLIVHCLVMLHRMSLTLKGEKQVHRSANIKVQDFYIVLCIPCFASGVRTIPGFVALQLDAIGPRNWQKIPERCHASSRRTACCYSAPWNRNKGVSPSAESAAVAFLAPH